jgi:Raf kinase inhibitor-like YbhB/YbcL family protein
MPVGRRISIVGVLGALAWVVGGCGGGGESPSGGAAVSPAGGGPASGFMLSSTSISEGGAIPRQYSFNGGNVSPPLSWTGVPEGTAELALVVEDPDAMGFTHWLIYGIPATASQLPEGGLAGVLQGSNGFGGAGWGGPEPPPNETHRYVFTLYALKAKLDLAAGLEKHELMDRITPRVIDKATLTATYKE